MSSLSVYHLSTPDTPNKVLTYAEDIASTLADLGVRFERWQATVKLEPDASQAELIGAYQEQVDKLMSERGYANLEFTRLDPDHWHKNHEGAQHLKEYRLDEDEVRFFIAGRGLFTLHVDDYVYAVLCEKNDLICIPAGIPHWFDMGENPHFVALRLFNKAQGLLANFTGDDIASRFPRLDD